MRIFSNTKEAYAEIMRDLIKFGRLVHSKTQQDKDVSQDENYITKEILGYTFSVVDCSDKFETTKDPDWCLYEFQERINQDPPYINPGEAWKERREYWEKYLIDIKLTRPDSHDDSKIWDRESGISEHVRVNPSRWGLWEGKTIKGLHYSYNERMGPYINYVLHNLRDNPDTRRAVISIWDQQLDGPNINNLHRVSCSMYYQLFIRENKVILEYVMRSSDFFEHFTNDFTLATMFKEAIANRLGLEYGETIMHIGSLHTYKKDWHHFEDKVY